MNITQLKLYAANGKCERSFCDIEKEQYKGESIFKRACEYTNRSGNFMRYGRKMEIISISTDYIGVKLYSEEELKMPSKSMSGFTRELLRMDKELYPDEEYHIFGSCMHKGALFKYQEEPDGFDNPDFDFDVLEYLLSREDSDSNMHTPSEEELKKLEYKETSDIDALKMCVDLFCGNNSKFKLNENEIATIKDDIKVLLRKALYTNSEYEEKMREERKRINELWGFDFFETY